MKVTFFEPMNDLEFYGIGLGKVISDLVEHQGADKFLLGGFTPFAFSVISAVKKLKEKYPYIECIVVLAEEPDISDMSELKTDPRRIYMPALSAFGKRDAELVRDVWLVDHSDIVVCYPPQDGKKDERFINYATRKGKTVLYAE